MNRSPNEPDPSDLEQQLRDVLRERAASTPLQERPTSALLRPLPRSSSRRPWRGAVVLVVAAAAVLVIGATQLVLTDDETVRTTADGAAASTASTTPDAPGRSTLPEAEVPRLLIEGVPVSDFEPDAAYPLGEAEDGGNVLQAFRRPGRLDGPMIFLTSVRDLSSFGLVTDEFGDPVQLRGRVGYVDDHQTAEGSTTMSVDLGDGTAIYVIAIGLTDEEISGFIDGLTPSTGSTPWTSTVDLQGMAEVPIAPLPADGRVYGARFGGTGEPTGDATVEGSPGDEGGQSEPDEEVIMEVQDFQFEAELNLYGDGFESRLADRVSSTDRPVEMVDVDGVPGALGAYNDGDWFLLIEPEPGRALELRIGGERATVDWIIEHARFVDEATWDEATGG